VLLHDTHPLGSEAGDGAADVVVEGAGDRVGEGAAEGAADGAAETAGEGGAIEAAAEGPLSPIVGDGEATEQPASNAAAVARAATREAGRRTVGADM
jgi:hypothetical protein